MPTYKQLVAAQLKPLIESGITQRELTQRLGLGRPNFMSMLLNPDTPDRLPAKRLPALQELCRFGPVEALRLVRQHAKDYPGGCELDIGTIDWVIRNTARAAALRRPA